MATTALALPPLTRRHVATFLIAAAADCAGAAARKSSKSQATTSPGTPAQRHQLAARLAESQQLDERWVRQSLAQSRHLPQVLRLILPAAVPSAKNWRAYEARFVEPRRLAAGVRFWQQHANTLEHASAQYGVPAEIVVGILGVETLWGQDMGRMRVLDTLATLALEFPAQHPRAAERQTFFANELGHYLALCHEHHWTPPTALGSYAGAMGMPQFMPSSLRRFAVDFDQDGRIDLAHSAADAIGSVAHYLQAHGWQSGLATHYAVEFDAARLDLDGLLIPDILPTFTHAAMQAKGVILPEQATLDATGLLALVELRNGDAPPSYVVSTQNFYTLTRYNWSSYYAMAVIALGQAVQDTVASELRARFQ